MLFVAEDVGKIRPHIEQLLAIQYKQLTLESLFCVCMRFEKPMPKNEVDYSEYALDLSTRPTRIDRMGNTVVANYISFWMFQIANR